VRNLPDWQREDELNAFRVFLLRSRMPVVSDSIKKRDPPEPDILCRLDDGNYVAFELVEIVIRRTPRLLGESARGQISSRRRIKIYRSK
jgi:hypothetical protein